MSTSSPPKLSGPLPKTEPSLFSRATGESSGGSIACRRPWLSMWAKKPSAFGNERARNTRRQPRKWSSRREFDSSPSRNRRAFQPDAYDLTGDRKSISYCQLQICNWHFANLQLPALITQDPTPGPRAVSPFAIESWVRDTRRAAIHNRPRRETKCRHPDEDPCRQARRVYGLLRNPIPWTL